MSIITALCCPVIVPRIRNDPLQVPIDTVVGINNPLGLKLPPFDLSAI